MGMAAPAPCCRASEPTLPDVVALARCCVRAVQAAVGFVFMSSAMLLLLFFFLSAAIFYILVRHATRARVHAWHGMAGALHGGVCTSQPAAAWLQIARPMGLNSPRPLPLCRCSAP